MRTGPAVAHGDRVRGGHLAAVELGDQVQVAVQQPDVGVEGQRVRGPVPGAGIPGRAQEAVAGRAVELPEVAALRELRHPRDVQVVDVVAGVPGLGGGQQGAVGAVGVAGDLDDARGVRLVHPVPEVHERAALAAVGLVAAAEDRELFARAEPLQVGRPAEQPLQAERQPGPRDEPRRAAHEEAPPRDPVRAVARRATPIAAVQMPATVPNTVNNVVRWSPHHGRGPPSPRRPVPPGCPVAPIRPPERQGPLFTTLTRYLPGSRW